jgi:hypothetical protein
MSEIVYNFSRLEAKEAAITDEECDAGNICSLVVGMTAVSGDFSAYIDGVTGHMNYNKADFSGAIGTIANQYASSQGFKESLQNQLISKSNAAKPALGFVAPTVTVE